MEHNHETGGTWAVTRWKVPGCPRCWGVESLTEIEREALGRALTTDTTLVHVAPGGPVERVIIQIITERLGKE